MKKMLPNGQDGAAGTARARGEHGFTLLETVIALLVMMVAGLGALSLFTYSVNYNAGASDRARAFAVAQRRMEVLRNTPYNNLAAGVTLTTAQEGSSGTNQNDLRRFDIRTEIIDDLVIDGTARRKTIVVTVRPQDRVGAIPADGVQQGAVGRRRDRWSSGSIRLMTQRASLEMGPN